MSNECKCCGSLAPLNGSCPKCGAPGEIDGRPNRRLGKSEIERLQSERSLHLAEINRLQRERDEARADCEAAEQRMIGVLDGTFSVGDGTAQREIERLRVELDRLRPVFDAARTWRAHPYQNDHNSEGCDRLLIDAIDKAIP